MLKKRFLSKTKHEKYVFYEINLKKRNKCYFSHGMTFVGLCIN
jgi:hypothetical protein